MRSGFLAAVALATIACGGEPSRSGPTNLLLVLLDTTRADHLSCYGHPVETTPTIDALARDGVRFDGAFGPSFHV